MLASSAVRASALESDYIVFDDLNKADNFVVEDYPNMSVDYIQSLNNDFDPSNDQQYMEIIQIAESSGKELFIYVYQPTDKELELTATTISISTGFSPNGQNIEPKLYDLELVSTYGVFDKYKVKGFEVINDIYRYYNIVSLYRQIDLSIDEQIPGSDIDGYEIGMNVGQQWCAYNLDGTVVYEKATFDTLDVDILYTGSLSCKQGITFGNLFGQYETGDLWFLCFNVNDYVVSKIYDGSMSYRYRYVTNVTGFSPSISYGDYSDYITYNLSSFDTISYYGEGLFGRTYSCSQICSSSDFISVMSNQDVSFSDDALSQLQKSQYVFAFLVTENSWSISSSASIHYYTDLEDITLLRLNFMDTNGKVYNLGVVSDSVNPDNISDGSSSFPDVTEGIKLILFLILIVILILLCAPLFSVIKLLFECFLTFFKLVLKVIFLPFKFVAYIFGKK